MPRNQLAGKMTKPNIAHHESDSQYGTIKAVLRRKLSGIAKSRRFQNRSHASAPDSVTAHLIGHLAGAGEFRRIVRLACVVPPDVPHPVTKGETAVRGSFSVRQTISIVAWPTL